MDGQVRAGEILTYTVIVDNLGPSWAAGVSLKDVMRSSGTFTVIGLDSDRDMSCSSEPTDINNLPLTVTNNLDIDCTLSQDLEVLAAQGFPNPGRWTLTMYVTADQTQDIDNVADVLSASSDPDPSNNHAYVEHEITDVADLDVTKSFRAERQISGSPGVMFNNAVLGQAFPSAGYSADLDLVTAGRRIEYTLRVTNKGPSDAENVVLTDRLPGGVRYYQDSLVVTGTGGGTCEHGHAGRAAGQAHLRPGHVCGGPVQDGHLPGDHGLEPGGRGGAGERRLHVLGHLR